jgi:membrane protease YdiL (CAAX protease family)
VQIAISKHKVVFFYLFSFAISWSAWFVMARIVAITPGVDALTLAFSTIGGLGPLISLLILEKMTSKGVVVEDILSKIKLRGPRWHWFLPAIFSYPFITILGQLMYRCLALETQVKLIKPGPDELGLLVIPTMVIHFVGSLATSPLFEEPGWRGFALGELQTKFGREVGSLIVGVLWWIWHQPMNITFGLMPSIHSFLMMLSLSFMIDSLFNLSGRNLLTAMFAHQSIGSVNTFLNRGSNNVFQLIFTILIVVILRFWEKAVTKRLMVRRSA